MAKRKRQKVGGPREGSGRRSIFPGKVGGSVYLAKRVYGVLTPLGYTVLVAKQTDLTAREGRPVSLNETLEWCIRRATKTPLDAPGTAP